MNQILLLRKLSGIIGCINTYIVARLPYSIFQPDLLHMRCWDEQFWQIIIVLVDYCTLPCQDWASGHSDLRTDVAIYVIFRAVIDAQFYVSSFSLDRWCPRWILLHGYDSIFYIVLWLLLLLYWFLWHILTCGIMIWRS